MTEPRVQDRQASSGRLGPFIAVGSIGFAVDGGTLTFLLSRDWGLLSARTVSFFLGVTATWLLNRYWTFGVSNRAVGREYVEYFLTQIVGALINLGAFALLTNHVPQLRALPLIPLAMGAALAVIFNYTVLRTLVFR